MNEPRATSGNVATRRLSDEETQLLARLRTSWSTFQGRGQLLALLEILEAQLQRDAPTTQQLAAALMPSLQQAATEPRPRIRALLPLVVDALGHPDARVQRLAYGSLGVPMPRLDAVQVEGLLRAAPGALASADPDLRGAAAHRLWIHARYGGHLGSTEHALAVVAGEPTDAGFYATFALSQAAQHGTLSRAPSPAQLAGQLGARPDIGEPTKFASGYGQTRCSHVRFSDPTAPAAALAENARFYAPAEPGTGRRPCGLCGSSQTRAIYEDGWADLTGKAWTEEYLCYVCGRYTLYAYVD